MTQRIKKDFVQAFAANEYNTWLIAYTIHEKFFMQLADKKHRLVQKKSIVG